MQNLQRVVLFLSTGGLLLAGATSPVPEPSTYALIGGGLAAMILAAKFRRNRK
jgi:hypothetical protein